jgi:predicted Zn-dependent protease
VVIDDPQINAFAVPGGLFALNTGLVLSARNMDEVAGVMAHEIAHVTQRHYSRSQEAFKGQGLLALAGILVGAALATQADGDVGGAIMMGTQAALLDKQLSYSRNQEREADRIGMQYMYSAGYSPQSMADFFEVMNRATSRLSYLPDFWFTHPLTSQRMSEARLRADQLAQKKSTLNTGLNADFEILKWYSAVLSKQATEQQLKVLVAQKKMAGMLALAKYYLLQSNEAEAQKMLQLVKVQGEHPLNALLQTDLYLSKNQIDEAYQSIISAQRIAPENRAFSYKLAEVLLRQQKIQDVQILVQKFLQKNPRDVAGWRLMQQAANLDTASPVRTINVLRYRAEAEYWSGEEKNAIKSLLHAQRLAKDNASLSAKIDARLTVMQDEYKLKI